jgi:hypothetical protein
MGHERFFALAQNDMLSSSFISIPQIMTGGVRYLMVHFFCEKKTLVKSKRHDQEEA